MQRQVSTLELPQKCSWGSGGQTVASRMSLLDCDEGTHVCKTGSDHRDKKLAGISSRHTSTQEERDERESVAAALQY